MSTVHNGCGVERERYCGFKYCRDGRRLAFWQNFWCQYSDTFCLHSFLNSFFGGGFSRSWRGWGSPYYTQRFLRSWNQDFVEGLATTSISLARALRMLPSRWQIMLRRDSWRRWRRATAGRVPARKNTAQSGVLSWSLISLDRVFLWQSYTAFNSGLTLIFTWVQIMHIPVV